MLFYTEFLLRVAKISFIQARIYRGLASTAEMHVATSGGHNLQQIIEQNPGTFTMQNRQSLTWLPLEII